MSHLQDMNVGTVRSHTWQKRSQSDLVCEVAKMCPGEPVPSEQWVDLQFCPKNPRAKTASQNSSQFKVKMMVHNVSSDTTMLMPLCAVHERVCCLCSGFSHFCFSG